MVIDIHVHLAIREIYPRYWLDGITRDLFRVIKEPEKRKMMSDAFLRQTLNDYQCDKLIASMDTAGINYAVVVMADFDYTESDESLTLDELYKVHYQAIKKYSSRFQLFGGCDPRRGNMGYYAFEKGIKIYKFKGLKLYPPCGFEINDPALFPLYDICDAYSLPVLLHIGPSLAGMKTDFDYPKSMRDICIMYKNVKFILGHGAVLHFDKSNKLPIEFENVYLDLSGFQSVFSQKEQLALKVKQLAYLCPDQVVFGTDWPLYSDQKKSVDYILDADWLTDNEKEKILFLNAKNIVKGW